MTEEQVKELAEAAGAEHVDCSYLGGGPLICGVGWGRYGFRCEFDSAQRLISYKQTRLKPLTVIETLEEKDLCER